MLRTIGVFAIGGRDAANFEYPTAGTAAQEMFDNAGISFFPSGVQERFPDDLDTARLRCRRLCRNSAQSIPGEKCSVWLRGGVARTPWLHTRLLEAHS